MNTKQILQQTTTEQQETSRIVKGYNLYISGAVTRFDNTTFTVLGDRGIKYGVDMDILNESYECQCPDHQNRLVVCKHIIAVQFLQIGL